MPPISPSIPAASSGQTWKLVLAYDGADYKGWQVQPKLLTIQGELARVLCEVTGETVLPQGSGRTDSGVHAEGQVVSLRLQSPIPPVRLLRAVNRKLPSAIRLLQAEHAVPDFHARSNVESKVYEYRIFQRRLPGSPEESICPPQLSRYLWDCRWPMDLGPMQEAAAEVVGTHDFTSFAAHDPDRSQRSKEDGTVTYTRTIFHSEWSLQNSHLVYRVCGNGFLHHMVRNLVGTFVEIGAGRRSAKDIPAILEQRSRTAAGMTAPPQGLFLMKVTYRTLNSQSCVSPTVEDNAEVPAA